MNSRKLLFGVVLASCLACAGVAAFYLFHRPPADEPAGGQVAANRFAELTSNGGLSVASSQSDEASNVGASAPAIPAAAGAASSGQVNHASAVPAPAYKPGPSKFRKAKEPTARVALEFVGADPDSERVWLAAINDPGVPAEERKDLIEDLNEDGLSDPRNPTRKDLPLIQSRIALIEQLLPSALDRVNADAFREAHKDLTNMSARLTGK